MSFHIALTRYDTAPGATLLGKEVAEWEIQSNLIPSQSLLCDDDRRSVSTV